MLSRDWFNGRPKTGASRAGAYTPALAGGLRTRQIRATAEALGVGVVTGRDAQGRVPYEGGCPNNCSQAPFLGRGWRVAPGVAPLLPGAGRAGARPLLILQSDSNCESTLVIGKLGHAVIKGGDALDGF